MAGTVQGYSLLDGPLSLSIDLPLPLPLPANGTAKYNRKTIDVKRQLQLYQEKKGRISKTQHDKEGQNTVQSGRK